MLRGTSGVGPGVEERGACSSRQPRAFCGAARLSQPKVRPTANGDLGEVLLGWTDDGPRFS